MTENFEEYEKYIVNVINEDNIMLILLDVMEHFLNGNYFINTQFMAIFGSTGYIQSLLDLYEDNSIVNFFRDMVKESQSKEVAFIDGIAPTKLPTVEEVLSLKPIRKSNGEFEKKLTEEIINKHYDDSEFSLDSVAQDYKCSNAFIRRFIIENMDDYYYLIDESNITMIVDKTKNPFNLDFPEPDEEEMVDEEGIKDASSTEDNSKEEISSEEDIKDIESSTQNDTEHTSTMEEKSTEDKTDNKESQDDNSDENK